jgi:hypothetical protein
MINDGHFGEAIQTAETALSEFPDNTDIRTLGERARNEQAEKAKQQLIKHRVREVERMLKHHQLTDAIDLARQTLTTLGNDPRIVAALQQGEKELEFREQKKRRQAQTIETAHTLLDEGKLTDTALLLKDAIEARLFSAEDPRVKALFEEIGSKRRPPTDPGTPREPRGPGSSAVSEVTLVQPATDPARDYVLMGGMPETDAPAHGEPNEVAAAGASLPSIQPSLSPSLSRGSSAIPSSSDIRVERETQERLDLRAIEKHLAISIGPMARIIVERATKKAKDPDDFFALVATSISSPADRQAFLARKKEFLRIQPMQLPIAKAVAVGSESQAVTFVPQRAELNAEDIHKASELISVYLGPISRVLAERAAQRSASLRDLYLILSGYLKEGPERTKFLSEAGFPEA